MLLARLGRVVIAYGLGAHYQPRGAEILALRCSRQVIADVLIARRRSRCSERCNRWDQAYGNRTALPRNSTKTSLQWSCLCDSAGGREVLGGEGEVVAPVERGDEARAFSMPVVTAKNIREKVVTHASRKSRLHTMSRNTSAANREDRSAE
jgi:hypothetical protein